MDRDSEHPRERSVLVLGDTPREQRRRARDRLAAGESTVLVGCGVLVEGWDSPEVRAVVLARAFGVCGGFLQAAAARSDRCEARRTRRSSTWSARRSSMGCPQTIVSGRSRAQPFDVRETRSSRSAGARSVWRSSTPALRSVRGAARKPWGRGFRVGLLRARMHARSSPRGHAAGTPDEVWNPGRLLSK
jgi:hypothetical protein